MPDRSPPSPDLADVATLAAALDWDARQPASERAAFDRQTARTRPRGGSRSADIGHWLQAACAENPELRRLRNRFRANLQRAAVGMVGLGLFLGVSATLGAFYYNGSDRVNVVAVLAALVLLPALLLIPFVAAALPRQWMAWMPGGQAVGGLFRGLNLGRLGWSLLQRLPAKWRETWESMLHRADRHQALYANLQKWTVLRWSQLIALGFQFAAVLTAGALVVFSDLVFGWSTTLASGDPAADARTFQVLTDALALPWSWTFDSALPSLALIEESRFFRAASAPLSTAAAARLGQWWPFILMAMAVYGLVPRLFTGWLSQTRLRAATRTAFEMTPGITGVLHRLHQAQVQTAEPEPPVETNERTLGTPTALDPPTIPGHLSALIDWASVPLDAANLPPSMTTVPVLQAGGGASLEDDRAVLAEIARGKPEGTVAVFVKAWEPPLLELVDFLKELRQVIGPGRGIFVVPVALDAHRLPVAPSQKALAVWQRQMHRANDPWLQTVPLASLEVFS